MTRTTFNILAIFIFTFASCFGQTDSYKYRSCDVDLRFELNRNSSIQFYDSTGTRTWNWENDSLDFIYAYFQVDLTVDDLVRINSIMILNGGKENNSQGWEIGHVEGNETVKQLEGSWIKLSDCRTELSEWMLYGNYEDPFTPYLFEKPNISSTRTQFDPREGWSDHEIEILEVKGTWIRVELKIDNEMKLGWMPSYNLCSHPHTTCN